MFRNVRSIARPEDLHLPDARGPILNSPGLALLHVRLRFASKGSIRLANEHLSNSRRISPNSCGWSETQESREPQDEPEKAYLISCDFVGFPVMRSNDHISEVPTLKVLRVSLSK
jgi:hypothetical protein